eukprot:m.113982 g.113982  ORF g.113982 m.113982 type:complete len:223 (+) comp37472_c0_seq15:1769-2437(+)
MATRLQAYGLPTLAIALIGVGAATIVFIVLAISSVLARRRIFKKHELEATVSPLRLHFPSIPAINDRLLERLPLNRSMKVPLRKSPSKADLLAAEEQETLELCKSKFIIFPPQHVKNIWRKRQLEEPFPWRDWYAASKEERETQISEEFKRLPSARVDGRVFPADAFTKNRFAANWPAPETIVPLTSGSYINANFVKVKKVSFVEFLYSCLTRGLTDRENAT